MKQLTIIALGTVILFASLILVGNTASQSGIVRPRSNTMTGNRPSNTWASNVSPANVSMNSTGRTVNLRGVSLSLVSIPAGSFAMGGYKYDEEKPVHLVRITKSFLIGRYEVTQAQWQAVMGYNSSRFRGGNRPVENVSWTDAQAFIQRLNQSNDGYLYRLPTEAEWEYSARAGRTYEYDGNLTLSRVPGGSAPTDLFALDSVAWYGNNSMMQTHEVGSKEPNAFGLYDTLGNVWEWCQDWYDKDYYQNSPGVDPQGPAYGTKRITRGGSWIENANGSRLAGRSSEVPSFNSFGSNGFRVVAVRR